MTYALVVLLVVAAVIAQRANELFLLSVRNGRVMLVRGRIPPALLEAITDVALDAHIECATLRATRGPLHARLVVGGVDDRVAQRFRNVFGIHPIRDLRAAPNLTNRNFGQWLGWTWLAWLLLRR